MKKRLKGLAALFMAVCLTIGCSFTAFAQEYEVGNTTFDGNTVMYSGDSIVNGSSSGTHFVLTNMDGELLITTPGDLSLTLEGRNLDQKSYYSYTLPENTAGNHGYTLKQVTAASDLTGQLQLTIEGTRITETDFTKIMGADLYPTNILVVKEIPVSYTVKLNANGSSQSEQSVSVVTGSTVKLANPQAREGYTFKNWNTSENGDGITIPKQATAADLTVLTGITYNTAESSATASVTNAITLYAIWEKVETEESSEESTDESTEESTEDVTDITESDEESGDIGGEDEQPIDDGGSEDVIEDDTDEAEDSDDAAEAETTDKLAEAAETGDANSLFVPLTVMFISGCAVAFLGKKREETNK